MRSLAPPVARRTAQHDLLLSRRAARASGMDHGERRSSAHGAAARPWRGAGAAGSGGNLPPPPPKVYRVEPRDFRELVQRLTGAGSTAAALGPAAQLAAQQRVTPAMVAESRRLEAAAAAPEQFDYASWYSAPLLSPAYGAPGFGAYHHQGTGPLL